MENTAAVNPEPLSPVRERVRTLSLRGLPTAWLEVGTSKQPLVVFLHGYPDSPEVWSPQVEALKHDFECIRPFSRGLLRTDESAPTSRYSLDSQLLDLLAIINQKTQSNPRPIYLIGHDLGGVLAMHLAPLLGAKLAGVVIFNSVSLPQLLQRFKTPEQLAKSWYIFAFQIPRLAEFFISANPSLILNAKKKIPGLNQIVIETAQLTRPVQTYRAFVQYALKHAGQKAPRLACPVLVLWGSRDPFLVTPTWEEWENVSEDVTFRILEAGHWLQWEKTEEVNGFLKSFLNAAEESR